MHKRSTQRRVCRDKPQKTNPLYQSKCKNKHKNATTQHTFSSVHHSSLRTFSSTSDNSTYPITSSVTPLESTSALTPPSSSTHVVYNDTNVDIDTNTIDTDLINNSIKIKTFHKLVDSLTKQTKEKTTSITNQSDPLQTLFDITKYIYPVQQMPITTNSPIIVMSTTTFQTFINDTFQIIEQYKQFLQSPHAVPLPSTFIPHNNEKLYFKDQQMSLRGIAIGTFLNVPSLQLETIGLTPEALAASCGFSHQNIPTPYKCLGPILKHQYLDDVGRNIYNQLVNGLPCKEAGTSGHSTVHDLERWYNDVTQYTQEREHLAEHKQRQFFHQQNRQLNRNGTEHVNEENFQNLDKIQKNKENELYERNKDRIREQVDELETKTYERMIRNIISQRLHDLGVKSVVVIDDIVEPQNEHFYDFFRLSLHRSWPKIYQRVNEYIDKNILLSTPTTQNLNNKQKLQEFFTTFDTILKHYDVLSNTSLPTQHIQSILERLHGFGLDPQIFPYYSDIFQKIVQPTLLQHIDPLITSPETQQQSISPEISVLYNDISSYMTTQHNIVCGLHINYIDNQLYENFLDSCKTSTIFSLLLKSHILTKKQRRIRRHQDRLLRCEERNLQDAKMRQRLFGSDDEDDDAYAQSDDNGSDSDGDDGDDDDDNDNDNDDNSVALNADQDIHQRHTYKPQTHITGQSLNEIQKLVHQKENTTFGPLVGVDFVRGITRTKRLTGHFDQKSPLIQAILGTRNAIQATPNRRNPLLTLHEQQQYNVEQQQVLLQKQLFDRHIIDNQQNTQYVDNFQTLFNLQQQQQQALSSSPSSSSSNNDALLSYWEQFNTISLDDSQNLLPTNNTEPGSTIKMSSQRIDELIRHYQTVDRFSPLSEIKPLVTLQQEKDNEVNQQRQAQIRHLEQQQQHKITRQNEWLQMVEKHVQSGRAIIINDIVQVADEDEQKTIHLNDVGDVLDQEGNVTDKNNNNNDIDKNVDDGVDADTDADVDKNAMASTNNKVVVTTSRLNSKGQEERITTTTTTQLIQQQRVYAENSAYIIRKYQHKTITEITESLSKVVTEAEAEADSTKESPNHSDSEEFHDKEKQNDDASNTSDDKTIKTSVSSTTSTVVNRLMRIFDATGGFGTDSFVVASSVNSNKDLEVEINMFEGDKVLFTLLRDGLRRAQHVKGYSLLSNPIKQFQSIQNKRLKSISLDKKNVITIDDNNDDFISEQQTIASLRRERYFPHAKTQLPQLHGKAAELLKLDKNYSNQQQIVELAEKALEQYIEGGLGDDGSIHQYNENDNTKKTLNPDDTSTTTTNPSTQRLQTLSQQHINEVSTIAQRLRVNFGNSLEYLTRQHYRVPSQIDTGVIQKHYNSLKKTTTHLDILPKIHIQTLLNTNEMTQLCQKYQLSWNVPNSLLQHNVITYDDETQSLTIPDINKLSTNHHSSPVLHASFPIPQYTTKTASLIYRPYDIIYMDPFYPVKHSGKHAKYKTLQRNSKFMSFAKSLQGIYAQQEKYFDDLLNTTTNNIVDKEDEINDNKNIGYEMLSLVEQLLKQEINRVKATSIQLSSDDSIENIDTKSIPDFNINFSSINLLSLSTKQKFEIYQSLHNCIKEIITESNTDSSSSSSSSKIHALYLILVQKSAQLLPIFFQALLHNIPSSLSNQYKISDFQLYNTKYTNIQRYFSQLMFSRSPCGNSTPSLILAQEPENTRILHDIARITANRRVVMKRPIHAPILHKEQTTQILDNKTRFDVITPLTSNSLINHTLRSIIPRLRYNYSKQYFAINQWNNSKNELSLYNDNIIHSNDPLSSVVLHNSNAQTLSQLQLDGIIRQTSHHIEEKYITEQSASDAIFISSPITTFIGDENSLPRNKQKKLNQTSLQKSTDVESAAYTQPYHVIKQLPSNKEATAGSSKPVTKQQKANNNKNQSKSNKKKRR